MSDERRGLFEERRRECLRNDPAFMLAILYTIGFFGIIFMLLLYNVPTENKNIVDQILPILSAIQLGIVQYFYTKTVQATAERKDETIKQLAQAASTTATSTAVAATAAAAAQAHEHAANGQPKGDAHV